MHFEVKRGKEKELMRAAIGSSDDGLVEITMNELKEDNLDLMLEACSVTPLDNEDLIDFLKDANIPLDEISDDSGSKTIYIKDTMISRTLLKFATLFADVDGDHIIYMGPSAGITFIYKNYKLLAKCFTLTLGSLLREGIIEIVLDEGDTPDLYTKYIAVSNEVKAFNVLMDSLPQSDGDVYATIGRCYEMGFGVDVDYKSAANYYRQGIKRNSSEAMFYYAEAYMNGIGVKPSTRKAATLLIEASMKGSTSAMLELGTMYRDGIYFEPNIHIAFTYFKMGAELDDPGCITEVGLFYLYGLVCKRSVKKAVSYFERLPIDEPLRYYLIAKAYDDEDNTDFNMDLIITNYEKAIDLNYYDAYYDLGSLYLRANEYDNAIKYFKKGSVLGNKNCKRELKHLKDDGVLNED